MFTFFPVFSKRLKWVSTQTLVILAVASTTLFVLGNRLDKLTETNFKNNFRTEARAEILSLKHEIEVVFHSQSVVLWKLAAVISENPDITQKEFTARLGNTRGVDPKMGQIIAAPDRVVSMIYPLKGNENLLGFDYNNSTAKHPLGQNLEGKGAETIVGPVKLQKAAEGFVLWAPVYIPREGLRRDELKFWGIVSIDLHQQEFNDKVGLSEAILFYDILIDFASKTGERMGSIFGDPTLKHKNSIDLKFDFFQDSLRLHATPKGGWPTSSPMRMYELTVMTLVAAGLLWLLGYVLWLAEKRKSAEMQLKNGIEALDDGFLMYDANDKLVLSNLSYREMYDFPDEIMQAGTPHSKISAFAILRENHRFSQEPSTESWLNIIEDWKVRREQARQEGAAFDSEQHLGDGRIIKATDRPLPDGSYVSLRVDVTELSRAKNTAEAASKAKTDFMNVLSHELRSPMTVVLGTARLANNARLLNSSKALLAAIESGDKSVDEVTALMDDMFAQVSNLMGRMIKSGDHMMELINGMLDFASIEEGSLTINAEACNIKDIVDPVEQQLKVLSQGKELNFEVSQDLGSVWADPIKVRQILFNLVGNAIKFTEAGSIQLTVKIEAKNVVFEVHDTGPGIPKGELDRVFDPFYQVDSTAARSASGTGMGLAISRNLAELNDGTLTVNSTLGQGSCFTLTLPSAQTSLDEV